MAVGEKIKRVDAYEKVTGRAKYTGDFFHGKMLCAKILHSTIANGIVTKMDISEAEKVPGVVKIVTCFDVPDRPFPTAGHPWSTEAAHQDVANRKLLNTRVRYYGDQIAAVVAEDEVAASRALKKIIVDYEEYPPVLTPQEAMAPGVPVLHEEAPGNVMKHHSLSAGPEEFNQAVREAEQEKDIKFFEATYETQSVQHVHIEPPISFAYEDSGRIVVVSSTQIPFLVRRVVAQALGIEWGRVRIIKPYIGGGFGNKQDILYEPLNAYMCRQVGGRCVKLEATREETFFDTRCRHAESFHFKTWVRPDGRFVCRYLDQYSNQGAYASHGHAIAANGANEFKQLYHSEKCDKADVTTVYTNRAPGGAMRAYGIPQSIFALESHIEDIARALNIDPIGIRKKNCMRKGYVDGGTGIPAYSDGLYDCMEAGRKAFDWDRKWAEYNKPQSGPVRRGVGMAIFNYKTGVYPISLETASCRMTLTEDGGIILEMGATEIGQGADTVFTQMTAEKVSVPVEKVHIVSQQDTDGTPFDTGAYASRQTYVSGKAVVKTGDVFRKKILDYAADMLVNGYKGEKATRRDLTADKLDLKNGFIVEKITGNPVLSLGDVGMESAYSLRNSLHITAEETIHCTDNTFAFGAGFVEVEVDIPLGTVRILRILNVHDSGKIINPATAAGQVHGGMSMGIGYGLSEDMQYSPKDGRLLNDNLLDYKLPTALDMPELETLFVENYDPSGPFGNKALGEPPAIPSAPAIRNAVLQATGVAVNKLPLSPQNLFEAFSAAGLIEKEAE
ncbi:MAG: xanthine dehydrogenase molybdenum-binding subunit XdhA [Treponema sp.]|jgi:xanthine dehydrogenase molybdenum-binding subunit|nr:xanthine dehydrogenase molybdenum-binding subunit XdhA [Treponema sp.]